MNIKPTLTISLLVLALSSVSCRDATQFSAGAAPPPKDKNDYPNAFTSNEPQHNQRVEHPYAQLIPELTPKIPLQLKPHSRLVLTDIEDRAFFDRFAWQTFIGLVWPADPKKRGVANGTVTTGEDFLKYNKSDGTARVPVVWQSFRTVDSIFPNPPADGPPPPKPPAWNAEPVEQPILLTMVSKGHSSADLNEAFSSPLIDQNRQFVRYNIRINEVMYEYIRQNGWYLKKNIPKSPTQASLPPLSGPITQTQTHTLINQPLLGNSIEIKSAWRVMIEQNDPKKPWRKADDLSRYYITDAIIDDVHTGKNKQVKVGLVGLHIVEKTPQFTQGIWASFEHIDNLKVPENSGLRPSFHNEKHAFNKTGYSYKPCKIGQAVKPDCKNAAVAESKRMPVDVSRIYKIPDTPMGTPKTENFPYGYSTQGLNRRYREILKGTVWENYQLVITQWPTDPTTFYAKPFIFPRGYPEGTVIADNQPHSVQQSYKSAKKIASQAYPRWAGLPLPQTGALNSTMETYFQNPPVDKSNRSATIENSSCMGCHYGASDMDFSWILKLRSWPQPFNQGRIDNSGVDNQTNTQ